MIGHPGPQTVGWKLRAVEEAVLAQIAAAAAQEVAASERHRRFLALASRIPFPRRGGA